MQTFPLKVTYPVQLMGGRWNVLLKWSLLMGHVNFRGLDPLEHSLEIGSEQQVAYSWMIAQESTKETLWTFSNIYSLTKATSSPASLYQTVRLISILIDLWKWLICASVCLRMVAITFSALWKNTMDNMDWLWEITRKEKKRAFPDAIEVVRDLCLTPSLVVTYLFSTKHDVQLRWEGIWTSRLCASCSAQMEKSGLPL